MRRTYTYPEGSAREIPGYGGFQAVATALSAEPPGIPVSRQGAYSMWKNRKANGFPELEKVAEPTRALEGFAFDLDKVRAWYAQRMEQRATRKDQKAV